MIKWKTYLVLALAVMFCISLKGSDFVIENYHIEARINKNGSVLVTEKISVNFLESRRGIIRSIPFKYKVENNFNTTRASRNQVGPYYHTLIKNINVPNHPFIHYEDGNNIEIRIGDPNKSRKGRVEYEITYTLWGVLNDFEQWVEFPFNVIGHEWDSPIEQASFKIYLPSSYQVPSGDLIGYSGYQNYKQKDVQMTSEPGFISGKITKSLDPYQGVSVSMKIPRKHFDNTQIPMEELTDEYYIDRQVATYIIYPNSRIEVKEIIEITCLKSQNRLDKLIQNRPFQSDIQQYIFPKAFFAMDLIEKKPLDIAVRRIGDVDILTLHRKSGNFTGKVKLELNYELYGNFVKDTLTKNLFTGFIPIGGMDHKAPVKDLSFDIIYKTTSPATALTSSTGMMKQEHVLKTKSRNQREVSFQKEGIALFGYYDFAPVFLVANDFEMNQVPYQVFARDYTVLNNLLNLSIQDNQEISAQQTVDIDWMYDLRGSNFQWSFKRKYYDFTVNDSIDISFPNYNYLSKYTIIEPVFVSLDTFLLERTTWEDGYIQIKQSNSLLPASINFQYLIPGLQMKEGNHWRINFPIVHKNQEPVLQTRIRLDPEYFDLDQKIKLLDDQGNSVLFEQFDDGMLIINQMIAPGKTIYLSALLYEDAIDASFWSKMGIYMVNHIFIIYSLLGIFLLICLWAIFGRNRKPLIIVRYYPPEGLTPAEIGWLYDDKIHNRDLISLIYYWAAGGHLEIEEIPAKSKRSKTQDYKLRKLKGLTSEARDFEKTLFNGLFKGREEVIVSKLENKFYTYIDKSKKQLEKHGRQNEFYIPGTRGFGSCLTALGFILSAGTVLMGVMGFFVEDQTITVAALILAIGFFIVGRMMPKKGQFGFRKYEKILGFKEFIEKAEMDRLRLLIDEDPKYFEKTIPYAVAFGLADEWSEKFEGLLGQPPSWYKSSGHSDGFNAYLFTSGIDRSIRNMTNTLSSRPASSGSSAGSGGSSFGGGFSSGGGFSGGGGSSW